MNGIKIEGQPIFEESTGDNNFKLQLQQIKFRCGIAPHWKPFVPGDEYSPHILCYNANERSVMWSETKTQDTIRFEDLSSVDQNEALRLIGVHNDGSDFSNWILGRADLEFVDLPNENSLIRAVSFSGDEPQNGIYYRNSINPKLLLCRSGSGWYWSERWIPDQGDVTGNRHSLNAYNFFV